MNQLHPGARWVFRLNTYSRFGFMFLILFYVLIFRIVGRNFYSSISQNSLGLALLIIGLLCLIILIAEIYARMSYSRFLYEITNDGIKIEQGIIWKKYSSIPYERVQNVDIQRGIIARMFGFSTVQIETAGQSGYGSHSGFRFGRRGNKRYKSEGYIPAVDVNGAEQSRTFVMKKIKQTHKDSGL